MGQKECKGCNSIINRIGTDKVPTDNKIEEKEEKLVPKTKLVVLKQTNKKDPKRSKEGEKDMVY